MVSADHWGRAPDHCMQEMIDWRSSNFGILKWWSGPVLPVRRWRSRITCLYEWKT